MYRVVVIDDEPAVLRVLSRLIDWSAYDMHLVGSAASGVEAIHVVEELKPHICFVDVQMPFMDGIEFSRIAKERYPKMKIIILSAYDQFDYARECLEIGVFDYRLKPVEKAEIVKTLERVKQTLDGETGDVTEELSATEERAEEKGERCGMQGMHQVMQYINRNYAVVDLTLPKVAMEFGFNASYLSRKFKSTTGYNFTDYLMKCRMECAMREASIDKPMYQVAIETGMPDPNYFGKCFKRYVGMTYSEYVAKR